MAKGKHKRRAEHQREVTLSRDIDALVAELIAADQAATAAEGAAAEVGALEMDLAKLAGSRDRAAAGEVTRLRGALEELEEAVAAEEQMAHDIGAAWEAFYDTVAGSYGGGIQGIEQLQDAIAGRPLNLVLTFGVAHAESLDPRAVHAIQKARGRRDATSRPPQGDPPRPNISWLAGPDVEERYAAASPAEQREMVERSRRIGHSPLTCDDPDVAFAWLTRSGLAPLELDTMPRVFGEVSDETRERWFELASKPDAGATSLAAATRTSAPRLLDARWANYFQPAPTFPRPSDAAVLRWWYRQAALGIRVAACNLTMREEEAEVERDEAFLNSVVDLLDEAALYWLPPGQAAAYLASRPLEETDRTELRLPYGRTLIVPAEPLVLAPDPAVVDAHRGNAEVSRELRAVAEHSGKAATKRARSPQDIHLTRTDTFDLGTAISLLGAQTEGVLIEADRSGERTGRIVWCVAVPSPDRTSVLTRTVIPALADDSAWGEVLDQLCAVTAWGDWTEAPEGTEGVDEHARAKGEHRAPLPGWLQILDVRRTESESASSTPTGRHVAPHTRRGHWRRQHAGPGGSVVRRVRIAPTVVNAARGPLAPRIYRLPRLDSPDEPAAEGAGVDSAADEADALIEEADLSSAAIEG